MLWCCNQEIVFFSAAEEKEEKPEEGEETPAEVERENTQVSLKIVVTRFLLHCMCC